MRSPSMLASSSGHKRLKRNQKMKGLEEDASISLAQKNQEENTKTGAKHPTQPATEEKVVAKRMPDKSLLESVIDILQRTDRHDSFAQPIDANVVEGYYDIIKNPMDFGTMRAKLQEGLYTSMEEFEHDVFLVSNNAMLFNATATMYFRQARAIHELAKRVLYALKTDLKKFEDEFSLTRKPSKRPTRRESSRLGSKPRASRDAESIKESFIQRPERSNQLPASFSQDESIFSIFPDSEKQLVLGDSGISYKESLQKFVQSLGPTAKLFAARRLACLNDDITSSQPLLDDPNRGMEKGEAIDETSEIAINDLKPMIANRIENKGKAHVLDIDNMKQTIGHTDWLGLSLPNNACYGEPPMLDSLKHTKVMVYPTMFVKPSGSIEKEPRNVGKLNSSSLIGSNPVSKWGGTPPASQGLQNFQWKPSTARMTQDLMWGAPPAARFLQGFPMAAPPNYARAHLAQEYNQLSVINPMAPPQQPQPPIELQPSWLLHKNNPSSSSSHKGNDHHIYKNE